MTETPDQIAERLLPCNQKPAAKFYKCFTPGHPFVETLGESHDETCPARYRPAVAAALKSERDSRDRRIAELEAALVTARDIFRLYGDMHAAKPDPVKAKRNYDLADQMSSALSVGGIPHATVSDEMALRCASEILKRFPNIDAVGEFDARGILVAALTPGEKS